MKKVIYITVLIVFFAPFVKAQLADSPWPMFQHDVQHTGRSPFAGPRGEPKLLWSFKLAGMPGSPAIGKDGTIYLPTGMLNNDNVGYLYAIYPDGTQKWRYQFAGIPAFTTPAIAADGTIYVHMNGTEGNIVAVERLYALNSDGSLKWIFIFNNGAGVFAGSTISSPAIGDDGTIYVGSKDTRLYAVSPEGTLKWRETITVSSITSSPVIGKDGTIYIQDPFDLAAFTKEGVLLWHKQLANSSASSEASPSIGSDGTIYIGEGNELQAFSPDGNLKWKRSEADANFKSAPAIAANGIIYICDNGLYAINPNGTTKWKAENDALFSSSSPLIDSNGTIYWRESFLFFADNPDGKLGWQLSVPSSSIGADSNPAIGSDGVIYIPQPDVFDSTNQYLKAYGGSEKPSSIDQTINSSIPTTYFLSQNYPNPFNPSTTIEFSIPKDDRVILTVFNSIGMKIEMLLDKYFQPGNYKIKWQPHNIPSGVYFYRIQTNNFTETKKLILLK